MEGNFKICAECNSFLNSVYQFVTKTKLIDAMFLEFEQVEFQTQLPEPTEVQDQMNQVSQLQDSQLQDCAMPPSEPKLEYENYVNDVRHKFGLKPLDMSVEVLNNLFDESNITGALEIKLESDLGDFEAHDTLSDDQEFSESSEEEDESEIEQLSDSQLRKHEETHQYQEESSESEHEERKTKKKKYRKSDEEKLFE